MFSASDYPHLPGENQGRPVQVVTADKLSEISGNFAAFAIHEGDVIEFDDVDVPHVVSQPVRETPNSPVAYYLGVTRNGKASYIGVGTLTKRDAEGSPLDDFRREMLKQPSFKEIWSELRGKKIRGSRMRTYKFPVFKDGQRTEETQERQMCEITYA